jgi:uncharacterized membrane protein YgcG
MRSFNRVESILVVTVLAVSLAACGWGVAHVEWDRSLRGVDPALAQALAVGDAGLSAAVEELDATVAAVTGRPRRTGPTPSATPGAVVVAGPREGEALVAEDAEEVKSAEAAVVSAGLLHTAVAAVLDRSRCVVGDRRLIEVDGVEADAVFTAAWVLVPAPGGGTAAAVEGARWTVTLGDVEQLLDALTDRTGAVVDLGRALRAAQAELEGAAVSAARVEWDAARAAIEEALPGAESLLAGTEGRVVDNAVREGLAGALDAARAALAEPLPDDATSGVVQAAAAALAGALPPLADASQAVGESQAAWQAAEAARNGNRSSGSSGSRGSSGSGSTGGSSGGGAGLSDCEAYWGVGSPWCSTPVVPTGPGTIKVRCHESDGRARLVAGWDHAGAWTGTATVNGFSWSIEANANGTSGTTWNLLPAGQNVCTVVLGGTTTTATF